jgi:hypothetical protein
VLPNLSIDCGWFAAIVSVPVVAVGGDGLIVIVHIPTELITTCEHRKTVVAFAHQIHTGFAIVFALGPVVCCAPEITSGFSR